MPSCDTCGDPTDQDAVVMTVFGTSTGARYTECPPCALERSEDEEYGPKTVSIKSIIPPVGARLAPSLASMSTTWADGTSYRTRPWRKGGAA